MADARFETVIGDVAMSSDICDLVMYVPGDSQALLEVYCIDAGESMLYQYMTAWDATSGEMVLHDLGDLIFDYMRGKGFHAAKFRISSPSIMEVIDFVCVAADRAAQNAADFVASNPLMSSAVSLIGSECEAWFHYFVNASSSDKVTVSTVTTYLDSDGAMKKKSASMTQTGAKVRSVSVDPRSLLSKAKASDSKAERVVHVAVSASSSKMPKSVSAQFFVDSDPRMFGFSFKNAFGLDELVFFRGAVTQKTESDCSEAFVGHERVAYDIEVSASFSVEAMNIPLSDSERISQFATSCDITELSTGRKVYVEKPKAEIGDDDSSLNTFKFTYRYVDDRPLMIVR